MNNYSNAVTSHKETFTENNVAPKQLNTSIHHDKKALSLLYDEWSELAAISDQQMCMGPDWVTNWWTFFGEHKNRKLHLITVRDNEKLVAIFPFYKGESRIAGKLIEERLQLIGSGGSPNETLGFSDDYGISDFLDFIVHPEYKNEVIELFISMLHSPAMSSCTIILHHLRDDSFIKKHLFPEISDHLHHISLTHTDTAPYISLSGVEHLKGFIKSSKSNARRRFRQTLRAVDDSEGYIIQESQNSEQDMLMTQRLIHLHQERWKEIGFPGAFNDERFVDFFKQTVRSARKKDQLWLKQTIDTKGVSAVRMLLKYNGRYFDYMSGFDDSSPSSKARPGIGLLLNLVEDAIHEPVKSVELLRGEEGYKYDFTTKTKKNWQINIPALKYNNGRLPFSVKLLHACSAIYRVYKREVLLMNIQHKKEGFLKMWAGYFKFRSFSIRAKLKQRFDK